MRKFKTRKEILENPEFKTLLFEFFQEDELWKAYQGYQMDDDQIDSKLGFFIDRKMKQCVFEGV